MQERDPARVGDGVVLSVVGVRHGPPPVQAYKLRCTWFFRWCAGLPVSLIPSRGVDRRSCDIALTAPSQLCRGRDRCGYLSVLGPTLAPPAKRWVR
jgi:hypothetical protein